MKVLITTAYQAFPRLMATTEVIETADLPTALHLTMAGNANYDQMVAGDHPSCISTPTMIVWRDVDNKILTTYSVVHENTPIAKRQRLLSPDVDWVD